MPSGCGDPEEAFGNVVGVEVVFIVTFLLGQETASGLGGAGHPILQKHLSFLLVVGT